MLNTLNLFNDLSNKELDYLEKIIVEQSFVRGDTVFLQGDTSRDFYIIKHGQVEISVRDFFQEKKVITILKNGEFFGEMALFSKNSVRSASAIAFQNCSLYKIPGNEFEKILREQPSISYKLLGTMSKRLNDFLNPVKTPVTKDPGMQAKVVTVSSARAGYGKTTFATTLASLISSEIHRKVLYMDLDLSYGDGTFMMAIYSPRSIIDFGYSLQDGVVATEEHIHKFVGRKSPYLSIMPAPKDMVEGEKLRGDDLVKIINSCRKHYDYIIIDTNSVITENFLIALDMSDKIFFLVDARDSIAIKSNTLFFQALSKLNLPDSHIHLIMSFKSNNVNIGACRKLFKWGIIGGLPWVDKLKMEFPDLPYQSAPQGEFCNSVRVITKEVLGEVGMVLPTEAGFLSRWFFSSNNTNVAVGNTEEAENGASPEKEKGPVDVVVENNDLVVNDEYCSTLLKEIRADVTRGYLDKAQNDCLQLISLFQKSPVLLQQLGEIMFLKNDYAATLGAMTKVLDVEPENYLALAYIAFIKGDEEMKKKSLRILTSKLQKMPQYPDLLNDMGRILSMFGEFKESVSFFRKSLEINPDYLEARLNLALSLGGAHSYNESIESLKAVKPKNIRVYYLLGNFFYKSGKFFEAMAAFNRVSSINSNYFDTTEKLEHLGDYFSKLNNLLELHKRLSRNSPGYPDLHYKIGNLYVLLGKTKEAKEEFLFACQLKTGYEDAQRKLERLSAEKEVDPLSFLDEDYEKHDIGQEIVSPIPAARLFTEKTQAREGGEDPGRKSLRAEEENRQDGVVIT